MAPILTPPALQFGPPDPALPQVISVSWDAKAKVPLGLCPPVSVWPAGATIHASPSLLPDFSYLIPASRSLYEPASGVELQELGTITGWPLTGDHPRRKAAC